ncbi:nicotinate-nucleotide--dimethylbenzimidazole phosphoribosyltransferase [Desulfuribacillus alkaliarsenatis]|uniref:Nicotinate-nucleotide--dimethylbenzimidazole phosphoribosyltransferase n=1 Tax=Desulfuribacillus alkaliarsenatis TaxID=766136 RepID=A0A1E5G4Q7_9FIRM|nr:nicotinate-nucleotide--dimethylbenzimidazole phosphoribosyltransferase [Desulfuribacillus alkaliarsenatis]OEF98000.1 nicotinate-nucleotide--dimethylbenzimidazole phosphoribosyltransferase [Desulfuribacillus alkaliarsenatis]
MEQFQRTLEAVVETDTEYGIKAQERLDFLTKPPGSLGVLEQIAVKLACIQQNPMPRLGKKTVLVMAGDHGVVEEGVSAFPQEVTPQMVLNFLGEGAAINVLAKQADAKVVVTDVGVASPIAEHPSLYQKNVRRGTRNMVKEAAMTMEEAIEAIEVGIEIVTKEIDKGATIVATGEMGIGNTTPSSAILACFSGDELERITGRGTGVNDAGLHKKQQAIRTAIEINQPDVNNPLDVLRKVGGLEIAALTGVILGAAAKKVPVVIDGFISTAAALVAYKLKPETKDYIIASHISQEPGHKVMLDMIGLQPMLYLDMRLGEGTGAVLAFHMIEAATRIINEMATFAEAGVSEGK